MLPRMRNPIHPSPERPIPLPDCILMDGWWADRRDDLRERSGSVRRLMSRREEGPHDRSHQRGQRAE